MKKTTGHLFKRGKMFYMEYRIGGERKVISLKVSTMREAEAKREELLSPAIAAKTAEEVIAHVAKARKIAQVSTLLLSDSWAAFEKSQARPDSGVATLKRYRIYWAELLRWIEINHPQANHLSDLTEFIIDDYFAYLSASSGTGRTFNAKRQAVTLVYKVLARREGLDKGLLENIKRKKSAPVSRKELSQEQLMDLLAVFDDTNFRLMNKEEMRVLFHIGAYTGMRLSDCAMLRWENVDMLSGQIRGTKTQKTDAPLVLPIHSMLAMRLRVAAAWLDDSGYVIPCVAVRQKRNPTGIVKDCAKVFANIGLESTAESTLGRAKRASQYGFHSLRHTFVSICAASGVPMALVQNIVGHASPAMTRHYTHLGVESLRKDVDVIPSSSSNRILLLPAAPITDGRLALVADRISTANGITDELRAELLAMLR